MYFGDSLTRRGGVSQEELTLGAGKATVDGVTIR